MANAFNKKEFFFFFKLQKPTGNKYKSWENGKALYYVIKQCCQLLQIHCNI